MGRALDAGRCHEKHIERDCIKQTIECKLEQGKKSRRPCGLRSPPRAGGGPRGLAGGAPGGDWFGKNNDGNILVSPHVNQVSNRTTLATDEYSALQSFEAGQIKTPRDLPPQGPSRCGTCWVMGHPDGERTRHFLKEHDVRYGVRHVVLYKKCPTGPPSTTGSLTKHDLYRTTFENGHVLIVKRSEAPRAA